MGMTDFLTARAVLEVPSRDSLRQTVFPFEKVLRFEINIGHCIGYHGDSIIPTIWLAIRSICFCSEVRSE